MKWFYISALTLTVALALSPFVLLRAGDAGVLAGKTVAYTTYGAKVKSIDPATCGDTTSAGLQGAFYESLYTYHYLQRPLTLIPQLAEGMPDVSDDRLTLTIPIKKGVRYHRNECFGREADGTPKTREVVAKDFVLAFKRIADYHIETDLALAFISDKIVGIEEYRSKTKGYAKGDFSRYSNERIEGIEALDEHTLRIRLKVPWPQLVYVLAINNYAPVPEEVIRHHLMTRPAQGGGREEIPLNDRDPEIREVNASVGTGAYYLHEWVKGSTIVLLRNEDYRDVRYPGEGEGGDKRAAEAARQEALERTGDKAQADAAYARTLQETSDEGQGLLADAGKRLPFVDARMLTYVQEDNPMWMLFVTRQADSAGIPSDLYSQIITPDKKLTDTWRSQGIVLTKSTSPVVYWLGFNMQDKVLRASQSLRQALNLCFNMREYIDAIHNGRAIRATTFIPSSFEGHAEAPCPYARHDLAAAREKIVQARKELADAGIIRPGEPIPALTVDMGGRDKIFRRMGEYMQEQFRKIGVELAVVLNDWPTLQEKVHRKRVQMFTMGWHADYPDPENFLQLYYSPNIQRGTNSTNFSDPRFDRLYEKASIMMPSAERTALYVEALKILNEQCPALLLTEPIFYSLRHDWVHNVKPQPIAYDTAKYMRIDAEARRKAGGR